MSAPIEVDVLCVGHACIDLAFSVERHPGPDEKTFATALDLHGGGPAANAALAVVRLGGSAAFCGYLGRDPFGDLHLSELAGEGVETALVARGPAPTVVAAILAKPDGRRTVVNFSADTPKLPAATFPFSKTRPGVVLVDGHEPDLGLAAVEEAASRAIPTVLDAGSLHAGTERLAPRVDWVVASEKFARQFAGPSRDREAAVQAVLDAHRRAVVTLGERGLAWRDGSARGRLPAYPVEPVDTNGAGDAFHGAFALGVARGMAWAELLAFASAAGALACTKPGARPSLPPAEAVRALMAQHRPA